MTKIITAALLFVFVNLFSCTVEAVPVPTFEVGKHVYVVHTGSEISGNFNPGDIENHLADLHYPTYVVIFSPGYRLQDMPIVAKQLREAWEKSSGYDRNKFVIMVYSRFPAWCGVHTPTWYKKTMTYEDLNTDDLGSAMLSALHKVNDAMSLQDAEVRERLKAEANAKEAAALAAKALSDKAAADLEAAKKYQMSKLIALNSLVTAVERCCQTNVKEARALLNWAPTENPVAVYQNAAQMDEQISVFTEKIETAGSHQRLWYALVGVAIVLVVGFMLVLLRIITSMKELSAHLRRTYDVLNSKAQGLRGFVGETKLQVESLAGQMRNQLQELLHLLQVVDSHQEDIVVWPWTFRKLRHSTRLVCEEAVVLCEANLLVKIQQIQQSATLLISHLWEIKGFSQGDVYQRVVWAYEPYLQTGHLDGLDALLLQDPLLYPQEILRRQQILDRLRDSFQELAELIKGLKVDHRETAVAQVRELLKTGGDQDLLGSVLNLLRREVGK